jgi:hypothetical protein
MRNAVRKALLAFACVLMAADSSRLAAETVVNNILSPFSTIKIIGSRPAPRPPYNWAPECNQGFSEWKPVCAVTLNRVAVTYPNRCMAELDNAFVIDERSACPITSSCAPTYEPVCARIPPDPPIQSLDDALRPPQVRPFINECFARAPLVFRLTTDNPPGLAADQIYGEVTIVRKYGDDLYNFPAPRQQSRGHQSRGHQPQEHKYRIHSRSGLEDFAEVCPTTCPEGGLVVCAVDHNNQPRLYKNRCSAVLAGADLTRFKLGDLSKCK